MVALDRNIAARRVVRFSRAPSLRWWQRHPEAGLMVGWAVIVAGATAVYLLL
jgi:hypothetical protein